MLRTNITVSLQKEKKKIVKLVIKISFFTPDSCKKSCSRNDKFTWAKDKVISSYVYFTVYPENQIYNENRNIVKTLFKDYVCQLPAFFINLIKVHMTQKFLFHLLLVTICNIKQFDNIENH